MTLRRLARALGISLLVALGLPGAADAALPFAPCDPKIASLDIGTGKTSALCAAVAVPLDRSGLVPGTVNLRVFFGTGSAPPPRRTLLFLAGGPGQPGGFAPLLGEFLLNPLGVGLDVIGIDQRGTGLSALACSELQRQAIDDILTALPGSVETCGLALGAAAGQYSTTASVEDIEAVRQALGIEKLTLWGISYGTYTAERYARAYPQHVEGLILDSVVPQQNVDPLQIANIRRVPHVLRELCKPPRCKGITNDLVADTASVVRKLAGGPLRAPVVNRNGKPVPSSIANGTELLAELIDASVYGTLGQLPGALAAAGKGDAVPLVTLVSDARAGLVQSADIYDQTLHVATLCGDLPAPWGTASSPAERIAARDAALAAVNPADLAPFDVATVRGIAVLDSCERWPQGGAPPPAPGPLPDVPTLFLSGDLDLSTPLGDAETEVARSPHATWLQVPGVGHGATVGADCAIAALKAFLGGTAVSTTCPPTAPSPLPLRYARTLAELPAVKGQSGLAGRLAALANATLLYASRRVVSSSSPKGAKVITVGGLRRGTATFTASGGVRLRNNEFVPGVRLTGTLKTTASGVSGRLTVMGSVLATAVIAKGKVTVTPR